MIDHALRSALLYYRLGAISQTSRTYSLRSKTGILYIFLPCLPYVLSEIRLARFTYHHHLPTNLEPSPDYVYEKNGILPENQDFNHCSRRGASPTLKPYLWIAFAIINLTTLAALTLCYGPLTRRKRGIEATTSVD